jgi:murein DD-endopeptidase MepM/ murein hydrolase activator NlpD
VNKTWRYSLLVAAAALGLQACDQQPARTTVTPPQVSLPDDTPLQAPPGTATASPPVPAQTQPTTSGDNVAITAQAPASAASATEAAPATDPALAGPVAAPAPATPETAAMGAQPGPAPAATAATPAAPAAATPDGMAAPTELSRFFEEARGATAATPGKAETGSEAAPPPPGEQKISAKLPAVRNPGDPEGARLLAQRALEVPVVGIQPATLYDQYELQRGQRRHEAIDILAPLGTPVVAVDDGRIAKLFTSKPGGLTIYQFDRDARLAYYYAHLQRYADNLREGMVVKRGDLIGYVGVSGNADTRTPHLHFAVFKLGNPPRWWEGAPVNPYPALSRAEAADQVTVR